MVLGASANQFFPAGARRVSAFSPFVSVVFIILIIGTIIGTNRDAILANWSDLLGAVALLHGGGFVLGYAITRAARFDKQVSRTVSIEVGMQNSGLAAALAQKHFVDLMLAPVPAAMSAVASCLSGSLAAGYWRLRPLSPIRPQRDPNPTGRSSHAHG